MIKLRRHDLVFISIENSERYVGELVAGPAGLWRFYARHVLGEQGERFALNDEKRRAMTGFMSVVLEPGMWTRGRCLLFPTLPRADVARGWSIMMSWQGAQ